MTTWASITPTGGPKALEQARERVDQLRARIADERGRVEQAEQALAAAEAAERDQMAKAFTDGREPASNTKEVEAARTAIAEAQRRQAALGTAVDAADEELGEAVEKHRDKWAADSNTQVEKAREHARALVTQRFTEALTEMNRQHAIALWLQPRGGADEGRQAKPRAGGARLSAAWAANGEAVTLDVLLGWIREMIEPPPARHTAPHLAAAATADAA